MDISTYLPDNAIAEAIYASWESRELNKPRAHLGCSEIGDECERKLWLKFRHCGVTKFGGRMLRLFNRGHREEAVVLADLRAIGCTVWEQDDDGNQFKVSAWGGHFGGSCDAVAAGVPEAEQTTHIVEIKTVNDKGFKQLTKHGVQKANYKHFCQMQVYMQLFDLDRALYVSVNKDTDEIHAERIHAERALQDSLIAKAGRIIFATEPPPRIGRNPADFTCKFCDLSNVCWQTVRPPRTCRNCCCATPSPVNAEWTCDAGEEFGAVCPAHLFIPPIVSDSYEMAADGMVRHDVDGRVMWDVRDTVMGTPAVIDGELLDRSEVKHQDEPGSDG